MAETNPVRCAGYAALCDKRYDAVTFLATHNAFATEDRFQDPNQSQSIPEQLQLGVRGFLIDVHYDPKWKALALCHSDCNKGSIGFDATLKSFRIFLNENPGEVITLIVQDEVPNREIWGALMASDLGPMLHIQERGAPWPTLGEMVAANHRVVVFTENNKNVFTGNYENEAADPVTRIERYPGLHIAYDHMWDCPYGFVPPPDDPLPCPILRGRPENPLFLLNHFVTRKWVSREERKKAQPLLIERAPACRATMGRQPNFLAIDWAGAPGYAGALQSIKAMIDEMNQIR